MGGRKGRTYSATRAIAPTGGAILAILVLAGSRQVALDLHGTGVDSICRGGVRLDRQPGGSSASADAEVDGRVVTQGAAGAAPLAGLAGGVPGRVEVVLGGCRLAFPHVVFGSVRAGEGLGGAGFNFGGDGFGFGAWVVGSADGDDGAGVVLRVDVARAGHAEAGGEG